MGAVERDQLAPGGFRPAGVPPHRSYVLPLPGTALLPLSPPRVPGQKAQSGLPPVPRTPRLHQPARTPRAASRWSRPPSPTADTPRKRTKAAPRKPLKANAAGKPGQS
ncbi:hypothetical protein SKAU_G00119050 [Synaphobranchus kaupii]|uniref:Uncharacterized protein n=1 Tax=Synaphobranchus kaupii TaxID=118154 RepID=A0A9Q1FNH2_SYNKA|nr:hypothetical protein SKAU_G00119050 [Synaphobranchus kaupii]